MHDLLPEGVGLELVDVSDHALPFLLQGVPLTPILLSPLLDPLQFLFIEFQILLNFFAPIVLIIAINTQLAALHLQLLQLPPPLLVLLL